MPEILTKSASPTTTTSPSTGTTPSPQAEAGSEPAGAAPDGTRQTVRRRAGTEVLTAHQPLAPTTLTMPNGYEIDALPGKDVILSRGGVPVQVLPLARFHKEYEPADPRALTLSGADRATIERTLGFAATETPQHLVTAITRMARLSIGQIEVDFSPGQWEELSHRAAKMRLTTGDLVKRIVGKLTQDLFTGA